MQSHTLPKNLREWTTFSSAFAFGVIILLVCISIVSGAGRETLPVIAFTTGAAGVWCLAYAFRGRFPAVADFIRFFLHLILYGAFYAYVHAMMAVAHPAVVDASLVRIDLAMFGTNPNAWLGNHGFPLLTDILYLSYFSYYFGMPVLLILMWRNNKEQDFRLVLSAMTIGWYGALLTYFLFPALGPQRFIPVELPALSGALPTTPWIRAFLAANLTPVVRDCVPSMHTGVTLLTLTFGYRFQRTHFKFYVAPACGLILATMYLQQHYVIDVLLGILAYAVIYSLVIVFKPR
jgi:hypothetical protein